MIGDISIWQTTSARENNPKAVFYGTNELIITPLALFLSQRSVDLFSGKTLSDAFFGDYFFYVGGELGVKKFLSANAQRLPKSLLLITQVSDLVQLVEQIKETSIKVVLVNANEELSETQAADIINFFLGSSDYVLTLSEEPMLSVSQADMSKQLYQLSDPKPTAEKSSEAEAPLIRTEKLEKKTANDPISTQQTNENKLISPPVEDTLHRAIEITASGSDSNETESRVKALYQMGPNPTPDDKKPLKNRQLSFLKAAVLAIFIFALMPLGILTGETVLGGIFLFIGSQEVKQGNFAKAENPLSQSEQFFSLAKKSLEYINPLFDLVYLRDVSQAVYKLEDLGWHTALGLLYVAKSGESAQMLFAGIAGMDKGVAFSPLVSTLRGNLALADTQLALIEAEAKSRNLYNILTRLNGLVSQYTTFTQKISQTREYVDFAQEGLTVLPETIGLYGKRTYLILLQNNMELRPTGGFIGSYGVVTFEDGVLKDFKIEDVYTADGQLNGHVDPPEPIRTHLGQEHWYLRDSNWDPDFTKSAARAAWFLEKEIDTKVDGVMALDLTFARYLLEITGPITLADYNETVSSENLFELAHQYVQTDFFPGSTQKRDFLGSLGRVLLTQITNEKNTHTRLARKLKQALDEKHLLLFFAANTQQQLVSQYGWAGEIKKTQCVNCIADYNMSIDANLGVNKVNYYMQKKQQDTITIAADGKITHVLKLHYKNTSLTQTTDVGGSYKNYLRVFIPKQAQLKDFSVNDVPLSLTTQKTASESSMYVGAYADLQVVENLLLVAPQEEKTVTLTYEYQSSLKNGQKYAYLVQKQPGTQADMLEIKVTYPSDWQLVGTLGQPQVAGATTLVNGSEITYNTNLSLDQQFEMEFAP